MLPEDWKPTCSGSSSNVNTTTPFHSTSNALDPVPLTVAPSLGRDEKKKLRSYWTPSQASTDCETVALVPMCPPSGCESSSSLLLPPCGATPPVAAPIWISISGSPLAVQPGIDVKVLKLPWSTTGTAPVRSSN